MIFNAEKILPVIKDSPNGSELKIFLYIVVNQPQDGIQGFRTTKEQLAIDLKLNIRTIFKAISWLIKNNLVQELKLADNSDFMASPYFVMNNSDRETRINEWNRRCRIDTLKIVARRKAKQKKLAKLNANN